MDDIDKFILTNFSKLDKKLKSKEKKEKEIPSAKKPEASKINLSNIIDDSIYSSITNKNQGLELKKELVNYFPNEKLYETEFQEKNFLLDKFFIKKKRKEKEKNFSAQRIKGINFEKFKYEDFIAINGLWKKYITQLIEPKSVNINQNLDGTYEKFLKADLHGAVLRVHKSEVENLVRREGIVILETKNTFIVITKENKINKILKKGTEFLFKINEDHVVKLLGDNFMFRPIDRTKKGKFKEKYILKN